METHFSKLSVRERRSHLERTLKKIPEVETLGVIEIREIINAIEGPETESEISGKPIYDIALRFIRRELEKGFKDLESEERKLFFEAVVGEFYFDPPKESLEEMDSCLRDYVERFGKEKLIKNFKRLYSLNEELKVLIAEASPTGCDTFTNPSVYIYYRGRDTERFLGLEWGDIIPE